MKSHIIVFGSFFLLLGMGVTHATASGFEMGTSRDDWHSFSTIGVQSGYLYGRTTYHISEYGSIPGWGTQGFESELEFPLQTFLAGINWEYSAKKPRSHEEFKLNAKWLTNIGDGSGKVRDSDWLTDIYDIYCSNDITCTNPLGYPHPGKDIYSTSDMKLRANIFDINASYNFRASPKVYIGPLAGYQYQKFQFDIYNLDQVGYGPWETSSTAYVSGKIGEYEVTYNIYYIGINSDVVLDTNLKANIKLGYVPSVSAEDRDDHMLRSLLITAKTDGEGYMASLSARWDISPDYSLQLTGNYLTIDTTGTQSQIRYADTPEGPAGKTATGIPDKITSSQLSVLLLFTYRFSL